MQLVSLCTRTMEADGAPEPTRVEALSRPPEEPKNSDPLGAMSGLVHGPESATSTLALGAPVPNGIRGVLQFSAVRQPTANIPSMSGLRMATPAAPRIFLVAGPGVMLLVASGVAGLAVLGHLRVATQSRGLARGSPRGGHSAGGGRFSMRAPPGAGAGRLRFPVCTRSDRIIGGNR